jgi:hypothetical protein
MHYICAEYFNNIQYDDKYTTGTQLLHNDRKFCLSNAAIFSAPVARGLPPNSFKGTVSREKFCLLRHEWINDISLMPFLSVLVLDPDPAGSLINWHSGSGSCDSYQDSQKSRKKPKILIHQMIYYLWQHVFSMATKWQVRIHIRIGIRNYLASRICIHN